MLFIATSHLQHPRITPSEYENLTGIYSGKEDEHGRFQWQTKVPEGVGKLAEDTGYPSVTVGLGWRLNSHGEKKKYSVKGRIIVDALGWNRYNPHFATYVIPLNRENGQALSSDLRLRLTSGSSLFVHPLSSELESLMDDGCDDCGGGIPMDGHFGDDGEAPPRQPLTHEEKLICTPLLSGYALKKKQCFKLLVNSVQITFNSRASESLVLPEDQKELILGFTSMQQAYRNTYNDAIKGKGRGIIILLCVPPGVGKTFTAESVAEEMENPLFVISAGDLGVDSRHIETRLLDVLGMCTRWNAIFLLDEADVFLKRRSLHELERNKIVSIFLRVIEYHGGIMFLTTNQVTNFDPAFHSRNHVSLDYPELSIDSRLEVWKNSLEQHNISQAVSRERPLSATKGANDQSNLSKEELDQQH